MSVIAAHQASTIGRVALQEAAREASLRRTPLTVIHVPDGVDVELVAEQTDRVRAEVAEILRGAGLADTSWTLQVATGADVAETVLDLVDGSDAELLVIGARRRSPVAKMFLGSVTQTIILRADLPVLVVKAPH